MERAAVKAATRPDHFIPSVEEERILHTVVQGVTDFNLDGVDEPLVKKRGSPFCLHKEGCRHNAFQGFIKGFWFGFALKGGISFLTGLLFRKLYRNPLKLLLEMFGTDTTRFAMFMGAFTGGYKAVQCFLRRARQKEDKWNAFAAGAIASSALWLDAKDRQSTWALWMLSRALDLVWRSGVTHKYLPDIPHGDALCFTLSAAQIMWAWHLHPYSIPRSYHKWISARGGLDDRVINGIRKIVFGNTPDFDSWCSKHNIPAFNQPNPTYVPCSVVHPTQYSCTLHMFQRWISGFRSGLPIYTYVHVLPLLVFRWKELLKRPLAALGKTAIAIFYSTSFIASFPSIFWIVFCLIRNMRKVDSQASTIIAGLASGASIFWEKPGRRAELALFTLPRALDSVWTILVRFGYVSNINHAPVLLFALAMGFIMMFYQHEPTTIKHTYLSLMQKYFGTN